MKGSNAGQWPLAHLLIEQMIGQIPKAVYRPLPPKPRGREAGVQQPELEGMGLLQAQPRDWCSMRSAPQRRHMAHLREFSCGAPRKPTGWTWELIKMHRPPGTVCSLSTQSPELLRPGKDTKHTAYPSLCPCGVPKNLSGLDLESAFHNAGPTWDSVLAGHPGAWAVQTWEAHSALGCGKPSVVHKLWALFTHTSSISLQCPSVPTTQLNKWA